MLQQLTFFTWSNLEQDSVKHTPYITFDNAPCDKVDPEADGTLEKTIGKFNFRGLKNLDNSITYEDKCYYLMDAFGEQTSRDNINGRWCEGAHHLPGGQKKTFDDNSAQFAGLSLEDFILPSIRGWQRNQNQNGYPLASDNGELVSDPQAAAALNIPVCDYLAQEDRPGVSCPILTKDIIMWDCPVYDASTGSNINGSYAGGECRVHFEQFQKNEGNLNLLDVYQLSIDIYDNFNRPVGIAGKQSAATPLEIVDTSLPFNLVVYPGALDDDPLEFWYADQHWKSDDKEAGKCSVGGYNKGSRKGDCGFACPLPSGPPPISATIDNALPGPPTPAVGGITSFINTFVTVTSSSTAPTGTPTPTYATGTCRVHTRQWQRNEGSKNPTNDYQLEVTIYDGSNKPIGSSGKMPAPPNKPVSVRGLVQPLDVTAFVVDKDPLEFKFEAQDWKSDGDGVDCSVGGYDSGHRDMDCNFPC